MGWRAAWNMSGWTAWSLMEGGSSVYFIRRTVENVTTIYEAMKADGYEPNAARDGNLRGVQKVARQAGGEMSTAVGAEIIEPYKADDRGVLPAVIEANFDALEAHVRRLVADYEGATYDMGKDENEKAAKRDRAYPTASPRDGRAPQGREPRVQPLAAFEDRCKGAACPGLPGPDLGNAT